MANEPDGVPTKRSLRSYERIEVDLRRRIERSEWMPGVLMPGRRELARQYGVDLKTLQRAIAPLLAEGLLRADAKRGTFIGEAAIPKASPSASAPVTWQRESIGIRVRSLRLGVVGHLYECPDEERNWKLRVLLSAERTWADLGGVETLGMKLDPEVHTPAPTVEQAIDTALDNGCEALLFVFVDDLTVGPRLTLSGVPYVFVRSDPLSGNVPHIFYDGRDAGYQAAEHLLQRGYRRLMVFSPFHYDWIDQRTAGVEEAIGAHGGTTPLIRRLPATSPWRLDYDQRELAHSEGLRLTAADLEGVGVIAANDHTAIGLMRALSGKGLVAGRDYGLVGYDDLPEARDLRLTSLRPPLEAMGAEGARVLMRALSGERLPLQVRLQSHLIPRESSQGAP